MRKPIPRFVDGKVMDERVWSRLPEDLIERMLAFLSLADRLRLRCVCKLWNSFLSAHGQLKAISEPSNQPYFLCLCVLGSQSSVVHVFNVDLQKWNQLSLSFLPPEMSDIYVGASCAGLLYVQARLAGETISVICNPLTKEWRKLPPMNCNDNETAQFGILTALTTYRYPDDMQGGTYKIIEVGPNGLTDSSTKVFDSSTRLWTESGSLPSEVAGFESEGVTINNCLYGMTCLPSKILKMELDGNNGTWIEFSAGLPVSAVYPHLAENLGSLVMVAAFDPSWDGIEVPEPKTLKIWKLDDVLMKWEEVSTFPLEMCETYFSLNDSNSFDSLRCASYGSAIFVVNYDGSLVLVYDFLAGSWNRLPDCPSLSNGQSCVEQFFIFNPSLQIMV